MKTDRGSFRIGGHRQLLQEVRGMRVTTTDAHLARRIGDALRHAYKGALEYRYNRDANLLRVRWSR